MLHLMFHAPVGGDVVPLGNHQTLCRIYYGTMASRSQFRSQIHRKHRNYLAVSEQVFCFMPAGSTKLRSLVECCPMG